MERPGLTKYKSMSIEFSKTLRHPIDVFFSQEDEYYICCDGETGEQIIEFETGHIPEVTEIETHLQKLNRKHYWENVAVYKKKTREYAKQNRGNIKEYTDQFRKDGRKMELHPHSIVIPDVFPAKEG